MEKPISRRKCAMALDASTAPALVVVGVVAAPHFRVREGVSCAFVETLVPSRPIETRVIRPTYGPSELAVFFLFGRHWRKMRSGGRCGRRHQEREGESQNDA